MKAKIITALFAVVTLIGCKKDDDTPAKAYPEENPLTAYLQNSGFNQKVDALIDASTYEFGYKFKPKVKGKINAVTFKIPDNATNVRVTIWNADSKTVLRTIVIPTVVKDTELTQSIDALSLDTSVNYCISYNGNDWYYRTRTNGSATTYPIEAGNLLITGYQYGSTLSQIFPNSSSISYYAGDLSIVFQQTD